MRSDGEPTIAGQSPLLACVSLGRCVMRRSVDGEPVRVASGQALENIIEVALGTVMKHSHTNP